MAVFTLSLLISIVSARAGAEERAKHTIADKNNKRDSVFLMAVGIIAWTPTPASARLSDSTGEMTPAVHNNNRLRGSIPPSLSLTETEVRPYAYRTDASQTVDYQQFITPPHTRIRRNRRDRVGVYLRVFFTNYCAKVLIYFENYVQKLTKGADKPTKQHNRLRQQP